MERLFRTDEKSWALLIQRAALGLVIFAHGGQKLFGWFGGFGFDATMKFFTDTMRLPAPIAFLVILGESLGAAMLVAGLATRLSAVWISAIMLGAAVTSHLQNGFFMNWFGTQKGEGFELHLLVLALSVPLAIWGGGKHAADSWLARRLGLTARSTTGEARPALA